MGEKLLSLCIPTNGISEWVFPVLNSIFEQNVSDDLFEVVVTNNGSNIEFDKEMFEYVKRHRNIIYKKTSAVSFLNEIESYKSSSGLFVKFVNHRTKMVSGSIEYLIGFIKKYLGTKPFVYFTTGALKTKSTINKYNNFDEFVKGLSYFSSWSTGIGFWRSDFNSLFTTDNISFNNLFPHTDILFGQRNKTEYIIDNTKILDEIKTSDSKKGKYDLFYAFGVEYPSLLLNLVREGSISSKTFAYVKSKNLSFLAKLYLDFVKRKKECSYDLSSLNSSIDVFYSKRQIKSEARRVMLKELLKKVFRFKK